MNHEKLAIDISKDDAGYQVELRLGEEGTTTGWVAGPPPPRLQEGESPEAYGRALFDWLLSAAEAGSGKAIRETWLRWEGTSPRRRIVLNLKTPDDEPLRQAAWECLHDGYGFLATDDKTPFCRTIDHPRKVPPPIAPDALRVLLLVPAPADQAEKYPHSVRLNPEQERQYLAGAFREGSLPVELKLLPSPCSIQALAEELANGWHVVHFVGHGAIHKAEPEMAEPEILIEEHNDEGRPGKAKWERAGKVVDAIRAGLGAAGDNDDRRVRLIYLASCDTGNTDQDTPRSLAYAFMAAGMPAVVAMQDRVDLDQARAFATTFYQRLLAEGRVDVAANAARNIEWLGDDSATPFIPVLYNRLKGGRLIAERPPAASPSPSSRLPPVVARYRYWIVVALVALAGLGAFAWLRQPDPKADSPTPPTGQVPGLAETSGPVATGPTAPPAGAPILEVIAAKTINVRKGPGTEYDCYNGYARRGTTWPVVGRSPDGGWWQIVWQGDQIAWVSSLTTLTQAQNIADVPTSQPPPTPTPGPPDGQPSYVNTNDGTNSGVNLRAAPAGERTSVNIEEGASVIVVDGSDDNQWLKIRRGCHEGWVLARYIAPEPPSETIMSLPPAPPPILTLTPTSEAVPTRASRAGDIAPFTLPGTIGKSVERVFVPTGSFTMGSDAGSEAEGPAHNVIVDAFWLDHTEVTNEQYMACVSDGRCRRPQSAASYTRPNYYFDAPAADYPVVQVTWFDAMRFCRWAGGHLPTEAQWEYAARGLDAAANVYPWGNETPSCDLLNYNACVGDTTRAGAYPLGASWVGALDMAGNVAEWVADWFGSDYYQAPSASENPTGPRDGLGKVLRGGGWDSNRDLVRVYSRAMSADPDSRNHNIGFRCAFPVSSP